jgi:hypothetical protein
VVFLQRWLGWWISGSHQALFPPTFLSILSPCCFTPLGQEALWLPHCTLHIHTNKP